MSLYYFPEADEPHPLGAKPWYEAFQPTLRDESKFQLSDKELSQILEKQKPFCDYDAVIPANVSSEPVRISQCTIDFGPYL